MCAYSCAMPAPNHEVLHYNPCMYVLPPEPCISEITRRPVAAVVARPRSQGSRGKKAPYRHVPHREKPPQLVARRNARERRRVQAVNAAFLRLRQAVPGDSSVSRGKRMSKVKTLQRAIEYICLLQDILADGQCVAEDNMLPRQRYYSLETSMETEQSSLTRWNSDCKEDDDRDDIVSLLQDFEIPQFCPPIGTK